MKAINIFASEGSVNNDVSEQISPNSPTSKNCASKAVSHSIINNTVFWKSITNKNSQKKKKKNKTAASNLEFLLSTTQNWNNYLTVSGIMKTRQISSFFPCNFQL